MVGSNALLEQKIINVELRIGRPLLGDCIHWKHNPNEPSFNISS
jgi:hypothetical protein